jgi:hypothetical protein
MKPELLSKAQNAKGLKQPLAPVVSTLLLCFAPGNARSEIVYENVRAHINVNADFIYSYQCAIRGC